MSEKYSKEESRFLKIGLYVAAVLLLMAGYYAFAKKNIEHKGSSTYYPVKATFGRTDGLLVGDKVRLAGVDIGRVTDAKLNERFHAVLTLEIRSDIHIPDDSSASIVSTGVMGPKYIEIDPGGSEDFIQENSEFSYTQDAIVLEELIDRIINIGKSNRISKAEASAETTGITLGL